MKVYIDAAEICRLLAAQSFAMITPRAFLLLIYFPGMSSRFVLSADALKALLALRTNTSTYVSNCDTYKMF